MWTAIIDFVIVIYRSRSSVSNLCSFRISDELTWLLGRHAELCHSGCALLHFTVVNKPFSNSGYGVIGVDMALLD